MKESIDIKSSHPDQFSTYIKVSVYLYQAFFFQMSALFGSSRKLWQSCKKNYRAPHLQEKVHLQSRRAQNLVSSQAPLHSCNYPAPAYHYNIFTIFIGVDCSENQRYFLNFDQHCSKSSESYLLQPFGSHLWHLLLLLHPLPVHDPRLDEVHQLKVNYEICQNM